MKHNVPGLFETANPGPEEMKYMQWALRQETLGCREVHYSWGPKAFIDRESTFKDINDLNLQVACGATEPHEFWDEFTRWERIEATPLWAVNRVKKWIGQVRLFFARRFS